jgi:hypothetical protein
MGIFSFEAYSTELDKNGEEQLTIPDKPVLPLGKRKSMFMGWKAAHSRLNCQGCSRRLWE